MKLASVEIENYRAIEHLVLKPDPSLTVLFGKNECGKTSVLSGVALGLGAIQNYFFSEDRVRFRKTDRRNGLGPVRVTVTTSESISWTREETGRAFARIKERRFGRNAEPDKWLTKLRREAYGGGFPDLPLVAYYDTDRIVADVPKGKRRVGDDFSRFAALAGALSARTDFRQFFQWFYVNENAELRALRKLAAEGEGATDGSTSRELKAVRSAVATMVNGAKDPRIEENPFRFVVTMERESGLVEELVIDQLSGGCRAVLTLAADLARRMAQGNPHLEDPLTSEAVVLIDEVELHLHPEWQQRILGDLRRTFPNAQFIVSTHSPQVLTTVEPKHVLELVDDEGRIVARAPTSSTFGVESGDVLSTVMGVAERPDNWYTTALNAYRRLVGSDQGESEEALALRAKLEGESPDDPALHRADLEMRQRKMFRRMAESE
ncbi:MAG: AAA family ATPase [Acidobacteria bacterium]|nr:AAA family ATPase [Acidobacteriota bacterium]